MKHTLLPGWIAALLVLVPSPVWAAPPANDSFAARTTISAVPFSEALSTEEATTEPGEPHPECGEMGRTVWYQFTPAVDMLLGANTFASDFDTLTAVWTGTQLDSLTPVTCADAPSAVFAAEAGTTYLIQVGGWYGDFGQLSFRLREVDAGLISGTVTEAGTGTPLRHTCVEIYDVDFDGYSFMVTDDAGAYQAAVRPGAYVVNFFDGCDKSSDHQSEWYDDAKNLSGATEVTVSSTADASNIDAALDPACPGWGFRDGNHIIGTTGADVLVGGSEDDIVCGLGGNDRLRGGDGRDILLGDVGADRLNGGAGADYLSSDTGKDTLSGGSGSDFVEGGNGRDILRGGADRDRMFGDAGDDQVSGGGDNDYIEGEKGSDQLTGGSGDDKLLGKSGDDIMHGGAGKDVCDGDEGDDVAGRTCERIKEVP
jgi:Ca2+-binding RTX toxin-like protein